MSIRNKGDEGITELKNHLNRICNLIEGLNLIVKKAKDEDL